jgi:hypothetical protein
MEEYEADRDSLQRMLDEYQRDFVRRRGRTAALTRTAAAAAAAASAAAAAASATAATTTAIAAPATSAAASARPAPPPGPGAAPVGGEAGEGVVDADLLRGMELMMRTYEEELKQPIKNLVAGDLARSMLIQVCLLV